MSKNKMFIPTNHIINDMFIKLQIHEQLNSIIFGPTYQKHKDFYKSSEFKKLIHDIVTNENRFSLIAKKISVQNVNLQTQNEFDNIVVDEEKSKMLEGNSDSYEFDQEADKESMKYWEAKIIDFLTRSNEKWILDQYKLVKQYLLENSIDSHITHFKHPVYNFYNGIENLKSFYQRIKGDPKTHQTEFDGSSASSEVDNYNLNNSDETIPDHILDAHLVRLTFKKCDASALIQSIEEIENKLKMEYILHKSSIADDEFSFEDDEIFQNYDEHLRTHLSILNFGRTFRAVKENVQGSATAQDKS